MTVYDVKNLSKIDTTKYQQGDIFLTNQSIGILNNGKIQVLNTITKKEIEQMIRKVVKENE